MWAHYSSTEPAAVDCRWVYPPVLSVLLEYFLSITVEFHSPQLQSFCYKTNSQKYQKCRWLQRKSHNIFRNSPYSYLGQGTLNPHTLQDIFWSRCLRYIHEARRRANPMRFRKVQKLHFPPSPLPQKMINTHLQSTFLEQEFHIHHKERFKPNQTNKRAWKWRRPRGNRLGKRQIGLHGRRRMTNGRPCLQFNGLQRSRRSHTPRWAHEARSRRRCRQFDGLWRRRRSHTPR